MEEQKKTIPKKSMNYKEQYKLGQSYFESQFTTHSKIKVPVYGLYRKNYEFIKPIKKHLEKENQMKMQKFEEHRDHQSKYISFMRSLNPKNHVNSCQNYKKDYFGFSNSEPLTLVPVKKINEDLQNACKHNQSLIDSAGTSLVN